jgi:putative flavoprotein involved in K+ transport
MKRTDTIIIGGGQAGLAMSRALALHGIEHVVLERGRVGERWRSERWHSLRLLTPAMYSALPGLSHAGADPEDFLPAGTFADYLDQYARSFAIPVQSGSAVGAVDLCYGAYRIATSSQLWLARSVIVATGACDVPYRPACAGELSPSILQVSPTDYRSPGDLPSGGVLVVGASSTGVQIAEEVHASGRPVTIAVGDHTRMPRRYRGRDIFAWMDAAGILDDPVDPSGNLDTARRQPSTQLVGRPDHRNLDLAVLQQQGVRLVGRLAAIDGGKAGFLGDLEHTTAKSHVRMIRVLQRIDAFIDYCGLSAPAAEFDQAEAFTARGNNLVLDLAQEGIRSVIWATGYRRSYPWLNVPVVDRNGEIIHHGGATAAPGLFVLGLTFLRRRRSSFIDGCGLDAEEMAQCVKGHLDDAGWQAA